MSARAHPRHELVKGQDHEVAAFARQKLRSRACFLDKADAIGCEVVHAEQADLSAGASLLTLREEITIFLCENRALPYSSSITVCMPVMALKGRSTVTRSSRPL